MDRQCKKCGSSDWREIEELQDSYPERRRERERTERRVFECRQCGAEGRLFEDGHTGEVTFSAALRA